MLNVLEPKADQPRAREVRADVVADLRDRRSRMGGKAFLGMLMLVLALCPPVPAGQSVQVAYEIQATTDFVAWTTIGLQTAGASGSI